MRAIRFLDVWLTPDELEEMKRHSRDSEEARAIVNNAAKMRGLPDLLSPGASYGAATDGELVAIDDVFPSAWEPARPS